MLHMPTRHVTTTRYAAAIHDHCEICAQFIFSLRDHRSQRCIISFFFFLRIRLPPISPLFPYTTLFRSNGVPPPVPTPPRRPADEQPAENDPADRERDARRRWGTEERADVRQHQHRNKRPEAVSPGPVTRPSGRGVQPHARDEPPSIDGDRPRDGVPPPGPPPRA